MAASVSSTTMVLRFAPHILPGGLQNVCPRHIQSGCMTSLTRRRGCVLYALKYALVVIAPFSHTQILTRVCSFRHLPLYSIQFRQAKNGIDIDGHAKNCLLTGLSSDGKCADIDRATSGVPAQVDSHHVPNPDHQWDGLGMAVPCCAVPDVDVLVPESGRPKYPRPGCVTYDHEPSHFEDCVAPPGDEDPERAL